MDDRFDDWLSEAAQDYNRPPEPPREAIWEAIAAARSQSRPEAPAPVTTEPVVRPIRPAPRIRPVWAWPLAAAAILLLGIALGRLSSNGAAPAPAGPGGVATVPDSVARPAPDTGSARLTVPESELAQQPGPAQSESVEAPPRPAGPTARLVGERRQPEVERRSPAPRVERSDEAYRLAIGQYLNQSETFLSLFKQSVEQGRREQLAPATARQLLATNRLLMDSPAAQTPQVRNLLQDLELVLAQIAQLPADSASRGDLHLITEGLDQNDVLLRLRTQAPARVTTIQGVL